MASLLRSKRAQAVTLVIVFLVMAVLAGSAYILSGGRGSEISGLAIIDCNSCADCTTKAAVTGDTVRLTQSITTTVDCITLAASSVTLDCQQFSITGDGGVGDFGVIVNSGLNNVKIKDCKIDNFEVGVDINSDGVQVNGSEISNADFGIEMNSQDNCNIGNNTFHDNNPFAIRDCFANCPTALNNNNIRGNTFYSNTGDIYIGTSGARSNNNIWLNNFGTLTSPTGRGISATSYSGIDFCIQEEDSKIRHTFGNYYNGVISANVGTNGCSPTYWANIPEQFINTLPVLCGATVIGNLVLDRDLMNNTQSSAATCPANGLTMGANNAKIDCAENQIVGSNTGIGIPLSTYTGLEVSNCYISNFSTGLDGAPGATLSENILDNTADLSFIGGTIDIYLNHFYGGGVAAGSAGTFCVSNQGNFYADGVSAIGNNDCGPINVSNSTGGSLAGADFYNISEITINWTAQDHASFMGMDYYVEYNTSGGAWQYVGDTTELSGPFEVDDVLSNTTFEFKITPYDGVVNGTVNRSGVFRVTNDLDDDGFSVLDLSSDSWDCNDTNKSIHQSVDRENDTSIWNIAGDGRTFCYNAVDDDCDNGVSEGGIDWLDDGCGHGFSVGGFDPALYINGTIRNISTSRTSAGSYYVLVNNTHGSVEYSATPTDLTGVDFDDYFTITPNSISVDPATPDSRFNKTAKVTFKGLSEYRKVPVLLVDGVQCDDLTCTNIAPRLLDPFNGELSFTASHFSTFTTASNAQVASFTQNESESSFMSGYPQPMEVYHRLKFFVNYSKYPSGVPINNRTINDADVDNRGNCSITLIKTDGTPILGSQNQPMVYDDYYGVYKYESGVYNFTSASGFYSYNISCNSSLYEPMNLTDTFTVSTDTTLPIRPILYTQILLYPTNLTSNPYTEVAGYFDESDINFTIVVLHGIYTYNFNGTSSFLRDYSEYKGEDIIVNFNSHRGENVTFTAWNPEIERALQHFRFVEFSNHNRSYFDRYYVVRANRTGDDLRIEFNETLDSDVPTGKYLRLYTDPHPAGYFRVNVSLFPGSNRIAVWGVDQAGNSGNATNDWINAPYPTTPPSAPILWPLPEVWKYDPSRNLSVIGFINESSFVNLNMTLNFVQGYNFSIRWYNESFNTSSLKAESVVSTAVPAGNDFFYVSKGFYTTIGSAMNFTDSWVEFSNHNRTHWMKYDVTRTENNPGEDARIYVSTVLETGLDTTVQVGFYDSPLRNGFFNITVNASALPVWNGSNEFYALAIRNGFLIPIEGLESLHQLLYHDSAPPLFNLSGISSHYPVREPTFKFNVSDDYKVNISSLLVVVGNSSHNYKYAYNSSSFPAMVILQNISCSDLLGNQSLYECVFVLNRTENGTYNASFSVRDLAGWDNIVGENVSWKNMTILVTSIDVTAVYDEDDITNDLWLYFNWTRTGGELDYYEFALGTARYPAVGFDSIKPWNTSCAVFGTGSCGQDWINFTHDANTSDINSTELKMRSGLVYYLTVRAKNRAGEYGVYGSSDGILFIDPSPPQFRYINDHGPWTKSNSRLFADWLFEDNESDIIEYMYALGNATYPNPGYNSIIGPVLVTSPAVLNDGLSLLENGTYYYSVKARNGNVAMNYSGSWSAWQSSNGVRVDTYPPSGGFVRWQNYSYSSSGFVTVNYKVGYDLPGTSDNVKGLLEIGKGLLDHDICEPISDFDWYNTSHVLSLGGDIDGEGYTDVNVTSGYCYVFRLFAWDNATNDVTYEMQNETLRVVKVDTTPPSDVAPVIDDGFYTNSRTSLHARWTTSTDPESGFDHYSWRIVGQPVAGFPFCVVNTTAGSTNCSEVARGSSTTPEISVNWLNLTHNHKYYFEVTPQNKVPLNYTTRYSDGIIYLDNAAPGGLFILTVNDANESHSPFPTTLYTNVINVTAAGDLDGYNDISNCVLLADNLDYREDSYAVNCTEYPHAYAYNETYPDTTLVNCIRNTSSTNATSIQGNFSWYLSCKDHYGNYNTFAQNTLVWFNVDWPEPPVISVVLGNSSGGSPVYASDNLFCTAAISDNEHDLNFTNITFSWFRDGSLIARRNEPASDSDGDGVYDVLNMLEYTYLRRGNNITCQVNASDRKSMVGSNSSSVVVRNTQPSRLAMLEPQNDIIARTSPFTWSGPVDYVDNDFFTLEIQIDKDGTEYVPVFNYSNNPLLAFNASVPLTVGGTSIPGKQRNADIYGTKIVYEDNRSGTGDWDIYMYDLATDEETPIATSPDTQHNPKIYGDFVLYEQGSGATSAVYRYNISSSVTTQLVSSINSSTMDFFGRYFSYNDGGGVRFRDVLAPTTEYGVDRASNMSVKTVLYGKNLLWLNSDGTVYLYDLVNSSSAQIDSSKEDADLFGSRVVVEYGGAINVADMLTGASQVLSGENMSIYGGLLAYVNSSADVVVSDLLRSNLYNVSLGPGNNPVMYDKIVIFERGDDLYYARRNITLPATFIFEDDPVSASLAYLIDTSLTPDNETYFWRIKGCDNSFANNSCVWGLTDLVPGPGVANFSLFNIDNTRPEISSVSPSQGSVVAGIFRVFADITDVNNVPYVNYTIAYMNGTIRNTSTMTVESGTAWHSTNLDFRDISLANFTLTIWAKDEKDNWNSAEANFTVNNNTAWFLFGTGDDEIVNGKVLESVINADFIAFNVFTSTIRIVGPLPATTVRSIQSKTNLTITNHNYSDPISTLTWPDGSYRAEFTGNTFDGTKTANRTFYVDKNAPVNSSNSTSPSPLYATDLLSIGINWTDITLTEVNFTYNNTNRSNSTQIVWNRTGNYLLSGYFNITVTERIDVSAYINRTFSWTASARDGRNRTSSYVYSVFVNDNPPRTLAVMPDINMSEDTTKPLSFTLLTYFDDPNTQGTWSYLDNLTYSFDSNCSAVSFAFNSTGGQVFNVTSTSNFTGYCNVRVNATDFYGKRNSSNFTLYVLPVNDYPTIDPIPDNYTTEDDPGIINFTVTGYDIDGDSITWLTPGADPTVFKVNGSNEAIGQFNFTLMPNAFGDYNITFRLRDNNSWITERNATVHIAGVNDVPVIGNITAPLIGATKRNTFDIIWSAATDKENGYHLNYSLEYSINGGSTWAVPSGCSALYENLSCSWASLTDIVTTENVTLRLNVTDGTNSTNTTYGNFTVDNQGPVITINKPTTIMVGSSFTTDISTAEPASCVFAVNGSAILNQSSTYLRTSHTIIVSGYAYNTTYNLSMACTDDVGNSVFANKTFEPRAAALEFLRVLATPTWAIQGQKVNLTLEIASNNTLNVMSLRVWSPSGATQTFTETNFTPVVDPTNKVTYLNGASLVMTSDIGKYNFTVDLLRNSDLVQIGPLPVIENLFEIFEAVNQTLNVN